MAVLRISAGGQTICQLQLFGKAAPPGGTLLVCSAYPYISYDELSYLNVSLT